jgi:hypothetical protein
VAAVGDEHEHLEELVDTADLDERVEARSSQLVPRAAQAPRTQLFLSGAPTRLPGSGAELPSGRQFSEGRRTPRLFDLSRRAGPRSGLSAMVGHPLRSRIPAKRELHARFGFRFLPSAGSCRRVPRPWTHPPGRSPHRPARDVSDRDRLPGLAPRSRTPAAAPGADRPSAQAHRRAGPRKAPHRAKAVTERAVPSRRLRPTSRRTGPLRLLPTP